MVTLYQTVVLLLPSTAVQENEGIHVHLREITLNWSRKSLISLNCAELELFLGQFTVQFSSVQSSV